MVKSSLSKLMVLGGGASETSLSHEGGTLMNVISYYLTKEGPGRFINHSVM